jgi:Tol biopolymer transport system component
MMVKPQSRVGFFFTLLLSLLLLGGEQAKAIECDFSSYETIILRSGEGRPKNPGWRFNEKIVYNEAVEDHQQVHTIRPDGSEVTCLTCGSPGNNDGPEWSPDGSKILFLSDRDHPFAFGSAGGGAGQELYVMDANGGNQTRLTFSPSHATNDHAHFSNSGQKVLWTTTANWTWDVLIADFVEDSSGTHLDNITQLTYDTTWYETHDFSPDDQQILFTASRDGFLNGEIYTMDLDSGEVTRLTNFAGWDEHAHFSPDGQKILWISSRHQGAALERFPLSGLPPILDFWLVIPATPMAFINPPIGYTTELYLMDANGENIQQLTFAGGVTADNSWSPDGTSIVYGSGGTINLLTFECVP